MNEQQAQMKTIRRVLRRSLLIFLLVQEIALDFFEDFPDSRKETSVEADSGLTSLPQEENSTEETPSKSRHLS